MVRQTDRPYMTIAVDWDVNNLTKQTNQIRNSGVSEFRRVVPVENRDL